jgi:hypothetical protein
MARVNRLCGLGMLLVALAPGRAAAQDNPPAWRWVDARGSFCIWYLSDPAVAVELLPTGVVPRPVSRTDGLPDQLLRIAQDEPRFAAWIPGLVCAGRYAVVAANGSPVARADREGRPVLFTLTALAAEAGEGVEWQLIELGLDAGHLDRVGEDLRIPSEDRELRVRNGLEGEGEQWTLRLDGAELIWWGEHLGESRVGTTRSMSFRYAGDRGSQWRLELKMSPATEQPQLGSLRVAGKGPLAQALKSSPIRDLGGFETGGEALMTFWPIPAAGP